VRQAESLTCGLERGTLAMIERRRWSRRRQSGQTRRVEPQQ
jgi:hypothetical protein